MRRLLLLSLLSLLIVLALPVAALGRSGGRRRKAKAAARFHGLDEDGLDTGVFDEAYAGSEEAGAWENAWGSDDDDDSDALDLTMGDTMALWFIVLGLGHAAYGVAVVLPIALLAAAVGLLLLGTDLLSGTARLFMGSSGSRADGTAAAAADPQTKKEQ